jgi:hypothetical protein
MADNSEFKGFEFYVKKYNSKLPDLKYVLHGLASDIRSGVEFADDEAFLLLLLRGMLRALYGFSDFLYDVVTQPHSYEQILISKRLKELNKIDDIKNIIDRSTSLALSISAVTADSHAALDMLIQTYKTTVKDFFPIEKDYATITKIISENENNVQKKRENDLYIS